MGIARVLHTVSVAEPGLVEPYAGEIRLARFFNNCKSAHGAFMVRQSPEVGIELSVRHLYP